MSDNIKWDEIKAAAIADQAANAPPPPTLSTQAEQNHYDMHRKSK